MKISELVEQAHENAKSKGFWEDWYFEDVEDLSIAESLELSEVEKNIMQLAEKKMISTDKNNAIATRLVLIHSEVSEALEALRIGDMENFAEELADIVIRVGDTAGGLGIDLESEITKKMEKNKARGYMHGKRF